MRPAPRSGIVLCAALLTALSSGVPAFAADVNGIPLCTQPNDQTFPVTAPDGAGGVIVAWHDARPGAPGVGVPYAQRLNAAGVPQWAIDGVPLSTIGDPALPVIVSDGAGGAYVAYGGLSSAPRVQHVDGTGAVLWGADGTQLTTTVNTISDLAIALDVGGSGGAFVAWRQDGAAGGTTDIFAQKVNSSGVVQWTTLGKDLTPTSMNNESLPALVSDGVGGIMIAWNSSGGMKAERFNSSGSSVWSQTPLSATANNVVASIASDGANGCVLMWGGGGTFIQRVTSTGIRLWGAPNGGFTLSGGGRTGTLIGDGAGGAIATWEDFRSGTNYNIYAQRMSSTGAAQWIADGSPVCTATQDQRLPQIVSDGSGGGIITWYDYRNNPTQGTDIYAQRIDGSGNQVWTVDGVPLCTAPNNQDVPTIASDGAGGAWVAWEDLRSGSYDIYAARVNPTGSIVGVPPGPSPVRLAAPWPDPFTDHVAMAFTLPSGGKVRMAVYDLHGRAVADLGTASLAAGTHRLAWDGRSSDGRPVKAGLYFLRVEGAGIHLTRSVVRLR